ncbi:MAG TPA: methionine adenosyltransferase [Chloroflexota bacterium]|nr:methionine adenosyltransferase [Chloroflexota bacterium]
MQHNIIVTQASALPTAAQPVEIVERKGIGHPDSLCDGIAERISVAYMHWCQEHGGTLLHHNFDKVQLVAGEVDVHFGGGEMLKPIRIQIAGRGTPQTPDGRAIPIDLIAINAAKTYLRQTMHHLDPDRHCVIDCFAGRGDPQLAHTVAHITANDTSIGVAHWPLSPLEETVLGVCQTINGPLREQFPIGEDVKVMGARLHDEVMLTCAVPFLAESVHDLAQYRSLKTAVQQTITTLAAAYTTLPVTVYLNMADDEAVGDIYLTLTGTSGECGDDGAVGRGNRVNGLITPFRPASLEAAAGKNPISHVGKLYNVLALHMAQAIVAQVTAVSQAQVFLLSQIGQPLNRPLTAAVMLHLADGVLQTAVKHQVAQIINDQLEHMGHIRDEIVNGTISLF